MWAEWSPQAFARAEAEKKPVLLSLVTAWSDECAAMDRTTYEDPDVESLIDDRFVAVRVDADRRPDVNERYNLGGWPTTVFLTSGGDILSGGTYLDPAEMVATLRQVADAYRDRFEEIQARALTLRSVRLLGRRSRSEGGQPDRGSRQPDLNPVDLIADFRALLVSRFDPTLPHPHGVSAALSLGVDGDSEMARIAGVALHHMKGLWESSKTLDDNAALLHVYVEAAIGLRDPESLEQAAAIVRWTRSAMSDESEGGFYNAASVRKTDKTMYVDRNAMMVGAFIRAAALFDDIWLRDFALKSLEAVIVPAYKPGEGVAHLTVAHGAHSVRGLLTDQIHVASALVWAHAATGQLPYSMLAAEVLQFAIRTMWDEEAGLFRDRVAVEDPIVPFELNCQAACVLDRLSVLTGDATYQERAREILQSLAPDVREQELFGAPYILALREVFERRPPAGLELTPVDWQLGPT
jgi:uncharacterized protein YyaL (SSP411 family)